MCEAMQEIHDLTCESDSKIQALVRMCQILLVGQYLTLMKTIMVRYIQVVYDDEFN